jgi:hypothetical protein
MGHYVVTLCISQSKEGRRQLVCRETSGSLPVLGDQYALLQADNWCCLCRAMLCRRLKALRAQHAPFAPHLQ